MLVRLLLTVLTLLQMETAPAGEKVKLYLTNGKTVVGELVETTDDALVLETEMGTLLVKKVNITKRTRLVVKVVQSKVPTKPSIITKKIVEQEDPFMSVELPSKKKVPLKTVPAPAKGTAVFPGKETKGSPFARRQDPRPAPGTAVPGARVVVSSELFYAGRLIDRYNWLRDLKLPTLLSILFSLWVIFWYSIDLFARILDFQDRSKARSASAATIWLALIVGLTLIPDPTKMVAMTALVLVLIAAVITARKVLKANWLQTVETVFLGGFGLFLVFLLVEVGQAVVDL